MREREKLSRAHVEMNRKKKRCGKTNTNNYRTIINIAVGATGVQVSRYRNPRRHDGVGF